MNDRAMAPPLNDIAMAPPLMTHGTSFADMSGIFPGVVGLIYLAFLIFYMYCQYTLSKKMNIQYSWMAWIPVLNVFNLVKIAGLSYWWILGMLIPIWNIYAIIKVYHGISKNTGHGAWWTVGLMFSTFIFLPVTAFHYLPGDEINPRPFTGWKKVVLILLPLGVPILLILSIILPSFLAHQSRSMDAMRISQILDISSSLSTYFFDTEKYPTTPTSGCIPYDILKSKGYIFGKNSSTDPTSGRLTPGCDGSDGQTYAYRSGIKADKTPYYIVGVELGEKSGNSNESIDRITPDTQLTPGSGKFYYRASRY